MDYYEQNLEALKKYRTPLYDRVQKSLEKREWAYPCDEVNVQQAKDGTSIFEIKREGRNVRLNSPYRPGQEAERWASQFSGENILVNAMLFGFGNGMFPAALLERLQKDAKLFICEPSLQIFETALRQIDLHVILSDERVFFFLEDINPDEFYDSIRENTHWTNLDTQIVCHHTGYEVLFPKAYRDFLVSVKKSSQLAQVNKDTQAYFSKRIVPNMIKNMEYIREGHIITDYIGKIPKDIPAIIVSAGPSLDKNIEELKRAKGKAFILAVDTSMRYLLDHGIMPDAMVTIDAGKPFSYMNNPELQDIPLFCALESNHEIMKFHSGLKIWFQGGSFLGDVFERYGKEFPPYQPGGSVATAAFAICVALEFQQIVLIGQDLAYKGDVTHAGGKVNHILNEKYGIQMIEGIDGGQVKSRHDWIIYLDWFEESIRVIKENFDTEVIDATEGGAMIHGSKIMTLAEVIDKYCTRSVDVSSILHSQPAMFTPEEYIPVQKEILEYGRELKDMKWEAHSAVRDCDEALKSLSQKKMHDKEILKLEKRVLKATSHISEYRIYDLVDIYMSKVANKYLDGVFVVSEDENQDEINMYRSSQMIFKGIEDAVDEILPVYEEMIQCLQQE